MFFQSQVTWQKERINLAIAVQVSNDTAVQDCEIKGRPLPLYPQFPPALFLEPIDDAAVRSSHLRSRLPLLTAIILIGFMTRSLVFDSPPCPLKKRVSEVIRCVSTARIIR